MKIHPVVSPENSDGNYLEGAAGLPCVSDAIPELVPMLNEGPTAGRPDRAGRAAAAGGVLGGCARRHGLGPLAGFVT
jgi:hypothetical protein